MTQTTSDIRSTIEATKDNLNRTVNQLEDRISGWSDWRGIVQRHPLQSVAASALIGLFLVRGMAPAVRGTVHTTESIVTTTLTGLLVKKITEMVMSRLHSHSPKMDGNR